MGEIFERTMPTTPLEWTGERFTTGVVGQIEIEHVHRYFFAREACRGLDVVDVASGEGYGSALLAQTARSVVGVDISHKAVDYANATYRAPNLRYLQGDAREIPLDDASVDIVVSFETIEHFYDHDAFLADVRRILRPGGRFIVSSPERDVYSPSGSAANPFHVRELSGVELGVLLGGTFEYVQILAQRAMIGSVLFSEAVGAGGTMTFEKRGPSHFEASPGLPRPLYLVAVASDQPLSSMPDSVYIEDGQIESVLSAAGAAGAILAERAAMLSERTAATERAEAAETAYLATNAELARAIEQAHQQASSHQEQMRLLDQASHEHAARARALQEALDGVRLQIEAETAAKTAALTELALAQKRAESCDQQRDLAHMLARRAADANSALRAQALDLERQANEWQVRCDELQDQSNEVKVRCDELLAKLRDSEHQTEELRCRYEDLRRRVRTLLRPFRVASRLIPLPARRYFKVKLLQWTSR